MNRFVMEDTKLDPTHINTAKEKLIKACRQFMADRNIPERFYPAITTGAGSCENVDTIFKLEEGEFLTLAQTKQLMMEEEILSDQVYDLYTCSHSYRREPNAGDSRHKNQFMLLEYECRDLTLDGIMNFAESLLKYCCGVFNKRLDINIPRISYDAAIKILQDNYTDDIKWGDDLTKDTEQYLCSYFGKKLDIPNINKMEPIPVFITTWPESLKFFNMFINRERPEVVDCVDLILPKAGEVIGASVREIDRSIIEKRLFNGTMWKHLESKGAKKESFDAYLNLFNVAEDGSLPPMRGGMGIGCGRLIQYLIDSNTIINL